MSDCTSNKNGMLRQVISVYKKAVNWKPVILLLCTITDILSAVYREFTSLKSPEALQLIDHLHLVLALNCGYILCSIYNALAGFYTGRRGVFPLA